MALKSKINDLTREGFIEHRSVEGEIKIFNNFLPNLLRDSVEAKKELLVQTKRQKKPRILCTNTWTQF